jgi:hypothetical protein
MGLKGDRLWVMGQLDSNVQSPTDEAASVLSAPSLSSSGIDPRVLFSGSSSR